MFIIKEISMLDAKIMQTGIKKTDNSSHSEL